MMCCVVVRGVDKTILSKFSPYSKTVKLSTKDKRKQSKDDSQKASCSEREKGKEGKNFKALQACCFHSQALMCSAYIHFTFLSFVFRLLFAGEIVIIMFLFCCRSVCISVCSALRCEPQLFQSTHSQNVSRTA